MIVSAFFALLNMCCCACSTLQCCYSCCRCSKKSTRARGEYFMMFLVSALVAWILRDEGYDGLKRVGGMKDCVDSTCTGRSIVLRISFSMALLSGVLMCLVFGIESSQNPRAIFQNGIWLIKWLALAGITIGSLYMTNEEMIQYAHVAAFGAALFLVLGIILVLEFAHNWNDYWVGKYVETENKNWARLIIFTSALIYGCCIAVWVVMFEHFGMEGCDHAQVFLSLTIVLSVASTFLSIWDFNSGNILVSSVMVAYATYLCTSAIIGIPDDPLAGCEARLPGTLNSKSERAIYCLGVFFTIACVGWATIRAASKGEKFLSPSEERTPAGVVEDDEETGLKATEDEEEAVEYNYSFFHFVYALGAMYLAMVMINWEMQLVEKDASLYEVSGWANVWVKMASQWMTFVLYIWTLVAPLILTNRDFS